MPATQPIRLLFVAAAAAAIALAPIAASAAELPSDTLTLAITVNNEFASTNSSLQYTLTVQNSGPDAADNLTVTQTLPDALQPTGASNGGSAAPGNQIQWSVPSIASGATLTLTSDAIVDSGFDNTVQTSSFGVTADEHFTVVATDACASDASQACVEIEIVPAASAETPPVTPRHPDTGLGEQRNLALLAGAAVLVAAGLFARRLSRWS